MKITVLRGGPLSTVQDLGRMGLLHAGFSPNGAMDAGAAALANLLVGNDEGEGVIEMTLSGMDLAFDCSGAVALTGADVEPALNGAAVPMDCTVPVRAGDVLTMKPAKRGLRTYLAVAGGFALAPVLGSVSTDLRCGIGGLAGRRLRAGDELPLRCAPEPAVILRRRLPFREEYTGAAVVRAVPGPQEDYFSPEERERFFTSSYTVAVQSDRMGIRLDGTPVRSIDGVDIVSDAVVTGSVQIPPSGQPIVMMADRQTTGGYAKIATVITADLGQLAQLRPGDTVTFVPVAQREAEKISRRARRAHRALARRILFAE